MKKIAILIALLVLSAASPAAAALNEYYTYGGFAPVTLAFENIGLIFSNTGYKGVIGTMALFGILFGVSGGFLNMAMGKGGPLVWIAPFLIGSFLYMGLFKPTMQMSVYDPVYNQNKVINDIPVGVVYIAGIVNLFERFVVETYDANAPLAPNTACGPLPTMQYQEFGGAVGMRLMNNSAGQYVKNADASQTLLGYVNDCVIFELNRPGTTLTLDQLLSPGCGKTSLDMMAAANSPANFTTSYFGSTTGTTKSCEAVYTELTNFFGNVNNTKQAGMNACAGTGFTDWARCEQILSDMVMGSTGDSLDAHKFIGNSTVVGITNSALLTGGGAGTAQYLTQINQAQSGSSSGFMAGIVNPYMIDAYVAYSFMLMPILALFLVTPLWKNAFGLIVSMIIWTALLRCLDVMTFHNWAGQYQIAAAAALDSAGMGIDAAMRLPTLANQHLGTFASMRNSVFLLATAVSGALFKFGDSALSRLADKANQDHDGVKSATTDKGVAAKMAMDNAAGAARASMMTALASGAHGWDNAGKGMAANEFASAAAGAGMGSAYSGVGGMMNGQSTVANRNTTQASARAGKLTESDSKGMGVNEAASQRGVLEAMGRDGNLAGWQAKLLSEKNLGDSKGFQAAHQEAQKGGYKGNITDFQRDMSRVSTEKGFADSQGWKQFVESKFGGNEQAAMQAATNVAAFQLGKHAGEVDRTVAGTGKDATGAGGAVGTAGGSNNLMTLASDNVRRAIAEQNAGNDIKNNPALYNKAGFKEAGKEQLTGQAAQHKEARAKFKEGLDKQTLSGNERTKALSAFDAGQAKERQDLQDKLKADTSTYQQAGLTELGYAAQMGNIAGANQQGFVNSNAAYGAVQKSSIVDRNGQALMTTEKGQTASSEEMRALGAELRANGGDNFKHTAKQIEKQAAEGKGFDFVMSRDKNGNITGFNAAGGASATLKDKAIEETGRLKSHVMKKVDDQRDEKKRGSDSVEGDRVLKDDSNVTKSGTSSLMDDSHVTKSGTSSLKDDSHVTKSGKSSLRDNSHVTKAGTSTLTDNTDRTLDGTSHRSDNLRSSVSGESEEIHTGSTRVHMGTVVDGATSSAVGAIADKVGIDRKTAEGVVGVGLNVASDVMPIAGAMRSSGAGGRLEEGKEVLEKAKSGAKQVRDKLTGANNPVRVDEAGRTVTKSGEIINPPSGTGAPAAGSGPSNAGPLDGMTTSRPDYSANGGLGPIPKGARPGGGSHQNAGPLDGMTTPRPAQNSNGGIGHLPGGSRPGGGAPKNGGGSAKAVRPPKIM